MATSDLVSEELRGKIIETAKASVAASGSVARGAVGSCTWSQGEQTIMNNVIQRINTAEYSTLQLCILVAAELPGKTIRDVAARLTLLRDQDPDTASLAAAAMGASAAQAGVNVPGAGMGGPAEEASSGTWRDPAAIFSGPTSLMESNHPSSFPFELQIAQLLQENMILIEEIRGNVLGANFGDNVALMEKFHQNVSTMFSMLSALPCALPALPGQFKINHSFLPHLTAQMQHAKRMKDLQDQGQMDVDKSMVIPPGESGSAYGVQAGICYPYHPNSIQGNKSSSSSSSSSSSVRPHNIQTDGLDSALPGASPANALQALPRPNPSNQ